MAKAPDCQFCGAFAYGKLKDTYHTSCGTYHMVSDGRALRSPECKLNQLRQVVREAAKRLAVIAKPEEILVVLQNEVDSVIEDLRKAVSDE